MTVKSGQQRKLETLNLIPHALIQLKEYRAPKQVNAMSDDARKVVFRVHAGAQ